MVAYIADEERITKLANKYAPKILHLLEMISDACESQGFMVEGPYEQDLDEYAWSINAYPASAGPPEGALLHDASIVDFVIISIYLAISEYRPDPGMRDGPPGGMSFLLDTVHYDGTVIGGFAPFNFTDEVWVPRDDRDDVEDRWHAFVEGVDPNAIVESIKNFYQRRPK